MPGNAEAVFAAEERVRQPEDVKESRIVIVRDDADGVALLAAVERGDRTAFAVYADWLEDGDDERAALVRGLLAIADRAVRRRPTRQELTPLFYPGGRLTLGLTPAGRLRWVAHRRDRWPRDRPYPCHPIVDPDKHPDRAAILDEVRCRHRSLLLGFFRLCGCRVAPAHLLRRDGIPRSRLSLRYPLDW